MRRPSDVRGNKPDSECLLVCTTLSIRSGHIHTSSRICALRGLVFRFFFGIKLYQLLTGERGLDPFLNIDWLLCWQNAGGRLE